MDFSARMRSEKLDGLSAQGSDEIVGAGLVGFAGTGNLVVEREADLLLWGEDRLKWGDDHLTWGSSA